MKNIDELITKIKALDAAKKAIDDQMKTYRNDLQAKVAELPDGKYENGTAKITMTKPGTSRKVNYDMLLGMIGEDKYSMVVSTSTTSPRMMMKWK